MTKNQKCLLWYVLLGPVLLVVAVFGNELIGWLDVRNELRLCREAGMELDPEKFIPPPVPEEQNGAPLLLEAFEDLDLIPFEATEVLFLLSVKGGSLQKDLLVEAKVIFDEHEPILQRVDKALRRPRCRYQPVTLESGIPRLSPTMRIARLQNYRVVYDYLTLGVDPAYQRVLDVFRMRKALGEERYLVTALVDAAVIGVGVEQTKMLLEETERPSADTARLLLATIPTRQDIVAFWWRAVEGETGRFLLPSWPKSHPGWFRITRPFEATHKAIAIRMYRRLHHDVGLPLTHADTMGWPKSRWYHTSYGTYFGPPRWIRDDPGDYSRSLLVQASIVIANAELTRLALLMELHWLEHGDYPKTLDEIVMPDGETMPSDPFDGKPYRYEKLADGYKLWSVGRNCVDDGGVPNDGKPWDGDITFWIGPAGKAAREEEKQEELDWRREDAQDALDEFRTEWKQYEADKKAGLFDDK